MSVRNFNNLTLYFIAPLLLIIIYLLFIICKSKKIVILPTFLHKDHRFYKFVHRRKKTILITISSIILGVAFLTGTLLAFSFKTKSEGDLEYRKGNYKESLIRYYKAQNLWFPEKINFKLRDRDLHTKIGKAIIMIKSEENFYKGVKAYEDKNYTEAKKYFSLLVERDPNKNKVEEILNEVTKIENSSIKQKIEIPQSLSNQALIPLPSPTIEQKFETPPSNQISTVFPSPTTKQKFNVWPNEPKRDSQYPIILKVSDNMGNYTTGSTGNGISLFATWPNPKPKVKIGQIVVITISAEDPNNNSLQYRLKNNNNQTVRDWSDDKSYSWNVTENTGGNPFIGVDIKDNDGILRFGDVDDGTVLYYELER